MKNIFRQQYAGVLHSRKARSAMRGRLSDDTRQHVWHYRKACFASPKAPFRTAEKPLPRRHKARSAHRSGLCFHSIQHKRLIIRHFAVMLKTRVFAAGKPPARREAILVERR